MIKKLTASITMAVLLAGCGTSYQFTDLQITGAATVATRAAMLLVPASHKIDVNNWMYYIASNMRSVSGNLSPEDLKTYLVNSIPADARSKFPELEQYVIPAIVDAYSVYYTKFSSDHTQLLKILNDIATGVEAALTKP